MKKYMTLAAFLAAGTAIANAGSVTAETAEKNNQGNYYGFTLALGTDSSALTYSDDIIKTATGDVSLDALTILGRGGNVTYTSAKIAIYEYTADNTVGSFVALSDAVTDVTADSEVSFTFDGVNLTLDTRYQFLFVNTTATVDALTDLSADGATLLGNYQSYSQQFGIAVTANEYAGYLPNGWGTYSNNTISGWADHRMPVLSVKVSSESIPEPSAFGLLAGLGALALVASRRRRNRR